MELYLSSFYLIKMSGCRNTTWLGVTEVYDVLLESGSVELVFLLRQTQRWLDAERSHDGPVG